jgi:hypothetical protein
MKLDSFFWAPTITLPQIFLVIAPTGKKAGPRAPEQGERYEFEVVSAKRGPRAINPRPEPPTF